MHHAILHLDIDAFFASVEQRDDPKLRGKPVAVGTGCVASCSYESRRHGVRTGMALSEARRRCRELIILPGCYPRYEQAARHVLALCIEETPLVEVSALDDLYLDLTQKGPELECLGRRLREAVRDEVQLSVSLGASSNKMVARVATNEAKPGKYVFVPPGQERAYLAPQSARVLPGVGHKTEDRLSRLNVRLVRDVSDMPVDLLRHLFGPQRGPALHEESLGIDRRPVEPHKEQQSVGRRASFDPPVAERGFLHAMLGYLLDRACSWLRFHHLATHGMKITIRYGDYESAEGRESFRTATRDDRLLREAARERFDLLYQRRLPLRFLGVELAPLKHPAEMPCLWQDPEEEKRKRLLEVTDEVRGRFGFTSLLPASALQISSRLERDRENFKMRTPCLTR